MKKVLVCGGSGFLGSHLCAKLRDEGKHVVVYDKKYPDFGWRPAQEYNIFDLTNDPDYYASFRWQDADECYQLAANMGGAEFVFSGENDAEIMQQSARINLNVLEACRYAGINKVFFASSACVYESIETPRRKLGDHYLAQTPNDACRENTGVNPDSPYGHEKLFAEQLYLSYARQFGMKVKIGRFHNVFGEHGTWRGGREKSPAAFCRKIAEVEDGGEIECFGDGEQTRSFIHASEAVEAVWRLMQSDFSGPVNIGSSEMVTINQMIGMIKGFSGKDFTVKHIPGPLGVRGRNSDNSLIMDKLGWAPSKPLIEGLEPTYRWIEEQAKAHAVSGA